MEYSVGILREINFLKAEMPEFLYFIVLQQIKIIALFFCIKIYVYVKIKQRFKKNKSEGVKWITKNFPVRKETESLKVN